MDRPSRNAVKPKTSVTVYYDIDYSILSSGFNRATANRESDTHKIDKAVEAFNEERGYDNRAFCAISIKGKQRSSHGQDDGWARRTGE